MRFKHRYLLCEVKFEDGVVDQSLSGSLLFSILKRLIETQFGDYGSGCLQQNLNVKYYNPLTGLAIIRCSRMHMRMVWNAVMMLSVIKSRACMVTCLHVGGTIRSCQKKAVEHSRMVMLYFDQVKYQQSKEKGKTNLSLTKPDDLKSIVELEINKEQESLNLIPVTDQPTQPILTQPITTIPSVTGELTEFINPSNAKILHQIEKELNDLLHEKL